MRGSSVAGADCARAELSKNIRLDAARVKDPIKRVSG
jgi:hypothetical protein